MDAAAVLRRCGRELSLSASMARESLAEREAAGGADAELAALRDEVEGMEARAGEWGGCADTLERLCAEAAAWRDFLGLAARVAAWGAAYEELQVRGLAGLG